MQLASLVSALTCFALIGALPRLFFRKDGAYNLMWFFTASPYFLAAVALYLAYAGMMPVLVDYQSTTSLVLQGVGVFLFSLSIGLQTLTIGTHRIPLALWYQDNDAPRSIVTWGAYKRIRHPFYTSFILSLIASICLAPSIATVAIFIFGVTIKTVTAKREEDRLSKSEMGGEYIEYMKTTGRFFPKF